MNSDRYQLKTAPSVEPLSTEEVKIQSKVDLDIDDEYIDGLIVMGRQYVEAFQNRALITQTWTAYFDTFPTGASSYFEIPLPPLQSVTSLKYLDTDGVQQTMSAALYRVDNRIEPGRIYLEYQQSWPIARAVRNAIEIEFVCGYGDAPTSIPAGTKHALMMLCAAWYDRRTAVVDQSSGNVTELPRVISAEQLLAFERIIPLGRT
jgi:uncharacterized phiE125 gp8 family phage protein